MWFVHRNVVSVIMRKQFNICSFSVRLQKIVRSIVCMALNISPPLNINNIFGTWLNAVPKTEKVHIRVGTCAILWAIWHVRNDFIFNNHVFLTARPAVDTATFQY
jgi:hypothetical protein